MARSPTFSHCLCIVISVLCVMPTCVSACPAECSCNSVTHSVICTNPALPGFPAGVPVDTQSLLIRGSVTHKLLLQELKRGDLKSLQKLQSLVIAHTLLSSVEKDAFDDLKDLRNLDLSFNQVDKMEPGLFAALSSLRFLHLTGNQHRFLTAGLFTGLTSLMELYLGSMRLAAVTPAIFTGLDSLVALDLSNNDLTELPVAFAAGTVFSQLHVLDLSFNSLTELHGALEPLLMAVGRIALADNPWHCSCGQTWLKSYPQHIYSQHGTSAVTCATPNDLLYEPLATVPDDRLACILPSVSCIQPLPVLEGTTLTVTCNVTGDPFPNVTWTAADGSVVEGWGNVGGMMVNRSGDIVQLAVQASLAWNGTLRVACSNQKGANHSDVVVVVYPVTITTTTTTAATTQAATSSLTTTTTTTTTITTTAPAPTVIPSATTTFRTIPTGPAIASRTATSTTAIPATASTPTPTATTSPVTTSSPSTSAPHSLSNGPTAISSPLPQTSTSKPKPESSFNQEPEKVVATDTDLQKITMFVALGIAVLALLSAALVGLVVYKVLRTNTYRASTETEGAYRRFNTQGNGGSAPPTPRSSPRVAPLSTTRDGDYLMPAWNSC